MASVSVGLSADARSSLPGDPIPDLVSPAVVEGNELVEVQTLRAYGCVEVVVWSVGGRAPEHLSVAVVAGESRDVGLQMVGEFIREVLECIGIVVGCRNHKRSNSIADHLLVVGQTVPSKPGSSCRCHGHTR